MLRRVMVMGLLSALLCLPAHAQYRQWSGGQASIQQVAERSDGRSAQRNSGGERRSDSDGERRKSMTPDERRELNRDLQRADREIYRKGKDRERR